MSRTAIMRKQHDAILLLAGDISEAAENCGSDREGSRLMRHLLQLDGILTAHLTSEDKFLYPAMLASADAATARLAGRFSEEMGGLLKAYSDFSVKWRDLAVIQADPASFRRDWGALAGALAGRIKRENDELYPLADAMGDSARAA